jgi:hypothetical protein
MSALKSCRHARLGAILCPVTSLPDLPQRLRDSAGAVASIHDRLRKESRI